MVCKPKAASTIEHQVIGSFERLTLALVVDCVESPSAQIHALYRSTHIIIGLITREYSAVPSGVPLKASVIAHITMAIWA